MDSKRPKMSDIKRKKYSSKDTIIECIKHITVKNTLGNASIYEEINQSEEEGNKNSSGIQKLAKESNVDRNNEMETNKDTCIS